MSVAAERLTNKAGNSKGVGAKLCRVDIYEGIICSFSETNQQTKQRLVYGK
jgi:hypothetical protein